MAGGPQQIRQMVNFILQEAHEKANEIRIKTEHDFNVEKQTLVHAARQRLNEEYAQKEREREVQARIAKSTAVGDARVKKMRLRDELLKQLVDEAKAEVAKVASSPAYPELVKQLIVQALIKIEENDVVVQCRKCDVALCEAQVAGAAQAYAAIIKKETGEVVKVQIKVNKKEEKHLPDHACCGGVTVTACSARIVCDNTLDARIALCYEDLLPQIRYELWDKHDEASK